MNKPKHRQFYAPALKAKFGLKAIRVIKTLNEIALEVGGSVTERYCYQHGYGKFDFPIGN